MEEAAAPYTPKPRPSGFKATIPDAFLCDFELSNDDVSERPIVLPFSAIAEWGAHLGAAI